ncbi:MAG: GntR family transcriptional regulator [Thermohalobaculum sp.]|nr:GntR family transcriptional regulator [Thermohalobaculum sp.]
MLGDTAPDRMLDQAQPITPQIYRILRNRIIRNDLKPGNRVSESEIARVYSVSRQPVREAFIKLAEQGLLAIRPQRGTLITRIDYAAVLDARFLREAIEADIVKLLAAQPDPAMIADLRAQIAQQRAAGTRPPGAFIGLDETFHRRLASWAGKAGAWKLIEGLKSQMDRVRFLALKTFPTDKLVAQHAALVEAIAAADPARAEACIRTHLREVLNDLPEIVRANPDVFDLRDGDTPGSVTKPIQGGNTP